LFCRLEDEGTGAGIPAGARDVSLRHIPRPTVGTLSVLFNRQRELFSPWVKRKVRVADRLSHLVPRLRNSDTVLFSCNHYRGTTLPHFLVTEANTAAVKSLMLRTP